VEDTVTNIKKVLFCNLYPLWCPHFETEIEIIKNMTENVQSNAVIFMLECNGILSPCEANSQMVGDICDMCKMRRAQYLSAMGLSSRVINIPIEKYTNGNVVFPLFQSVEEMKNYIVDGCDIGLAAFSSMISQTRKLDFSLADDRDMIVSFLQRAMKAKGFFENVLTEYEFDLVVLFNGRFAGLRPILRICQQRRIPCYTHERVFMLNRYGLFPNVYPHELTYMKKKIIEHYEQANISEEEKYKIATNWYLERIAGEAQGGVSFITNQKSGKIPYLDPAKINIAIFNSSEDEYEAIEGYANPIYKNQSDALKHLAEDNRINAKIHFFLRVHPNLTDVNNSQTQFINSLVSSRITVIPADSDISTYDLLRACDGVITYRSTVGIEACFMGKPSILIGESPYADLGGCIKPDNHETFVAIINNLAAHSIPQEKIYKASMIYGYFAATFGIEFRHFQQLGPHTMKYIG
jgi:hypothetical protein